MSEQIGTGPKKVRGMAQGSLDLIERMAEIAEDAQPITGRGVGYKLFTAGLIPSMSTKDMKRVYRLLKEARERGLVDWDWIVDETRRVERRPSWSDPEDYAAATIRDYRRDYWDQQPVRCEVWSEKGTIRGVLAPVLGRYGVGFQVMHGFTSATSAHDIAMNDDGRPLIALYVGDWDPSGLCMSERDLPNQFEKYDGDHVELERVALTEDQLSGLPYFPATDKKKDSRYKWFVQNFGQRCWEIDALDPNELRNVVEEKIKECIEPTAWERCRVVESAERESLIKGMSAWASSNAAD